MLNAVLAVAIAQTAPTLCVWPDYLPSIRETSIDIRSLDPQNIEGLLLDAPATLKLLPEQSPTYRAYQANITSTSGTSSGVTQIVTVVVTDLEKLEEKPTPDQICDLHDRASRTRAGFAGQLFKTEKTEIDGRPMAVLMGSMIGRDINQKPITMYHVSAALSSADKAYEITWYTYYGGDQFANAVKSVRAASLKAEDKTLAPKAQFGSNGDYTFLGLPYKFRLPKPPLPDPEIEYSEGQKGRYYATVDDSTEGWFASVEIAEMNKEITDKSPANLLRLLGYPEWADFDLKFSPIGTVHNCVEVAITDTRHARIDIAATGNRISAVIVSAPKEKPLPAREQISLWD